MSGEPTFRGTRVLVRTVFDYLEAGHGIEQFLKGFPTRQPGDGHACSRRSERIGFPSEQLKKAQAEDLLDTDTARKAGGTAFPTKAESEKVEGIKTQAEGLLHIERLGRFYPGGSGIRKLATDSLSQEV